MLVSKRGLDAYLDCSDKLSDARNGIGDHDSFSNRLVPDQSGQCESCIYNVLFG